MHNRPPSRSLQDLKIEGQEAIRALTAMIEDTIPAQTEISAQRRKQIEELVTFHKIVLSNALRTAATSADELEKILARHKGWQEKILPLIFSLQQSHIDAYQIPRLHSKAQRSPTPSDINNYFNVWEKIINAMPDTEEKVALKNKLNILDGQWKEIASNLTTNDLGLMSAYIEGFEEFFKDDYRLLPFIVGNQDILKLIQDHNQAIMGYGVEVKAAQANAKAANPLSKKSKAHPKETPQPKKATDVTQKSQATTVLKGRADKEKEPAKTAPTAPEKIPDQELIDKMMNEVEDLEEKIKSEEGNTETNMAKHTALLATIAYLKKDLEHDKLVEILREYPQFVKPDNRGHSLVRSEASQLIMAAHVLEPAFFSALRKAPQQEAPKQDLPNLHKTLLPR